MMMIAEFQTVVLDKSDAPFLIMLGIGAALAVGLVILFIIVLRKSKDGPQ